MFPFFLINILSGLARVPLKTVIRTTALGIIPGTAVFAYAGQQIGSINSAAEIFSPRVIIAFGVLALFAVVPALFSRAKSRGAAGAQEMKSESEEKHGQEKAG